MKIAFLDYWQTLDPHRGGRNWIWEQIEDIATLASPWTADLIIHSNYGGAWQQHTDKPRIFHNAEPWHKTIADAQRGAIHTFGFEPDAERTTRLPNWLFYLATGRDYTALGNVTTEEISLRRPKILAVVTNPYCPERTRFMQAAIQAGLMDSVGAHLPTHPRIADKAAACTMYRGVLAYENTNIQPRYITEKIIHAINADAVPVYWGTEQTDFNPASLINRADFPTDTALLDHLHQLLHDPAAVAAIVNRPAFLPGQDPREHIRQRIRELVYSTSGCLETTSSSLADEPLGLRSPRSHF